MTWSAVILLQAITIPSDKPQIPGGLAVGKKFVVDPEAWKIVKGTLYLNLDRGIQKKWLKDVPGYIKTADGNWPKIKDKPASDL